MLRNRNKYAVPLFQMRFRIGPLNKIQAFCSISGVYNFFHTGCVDKIPYCFLRAIIRLRGGNGQYMSPAMRVSISGNIVVINGTKYRFRSLGSCRIVKINNRMPVNFLLQNRKVLSDYFCIHKLSFASNAWFTASSTSSCRLLSMRSIRGRSIDSMTIR